CQHYHSLPYSF
nr:immunoglobulin light chain junction region [Macaca mulatta]